jgi:hypothetical protein
MNISICTFEAKDTTSWCGQFSNSLYKEGYSPFMPSIEITTKTATVGIIQPIGKRQKKRPNYKMYTLILCHVFAIRDQLRLSDRDYKPDLC